MPDRNVPWPIWTLVMLSGGALASPWLKDYLDAPKVGSHPGADADTVIIKTLPSVLELRVGQGSSPSLHPATPLSVPVPAPGAPGVRSFDLAGSYLTEADLAGLSDWRLDLLRNEIYARHGRRFHRSELQDHFDRQQWYTPLYSPDRFPEGLLSPVEKRNADFIRDYQQRRR